MSSSDTENGFRQQKTKTVYEKMSSTSCIARKNSKEGPVFSQNALILLKKNKREPQKNFEKSLVLPETTNV